MARIRSIKPEFRTSQTVTQWPREVRLFWALLWGYLDDHGYGIDDPKLIKADCFPADDDLTPTDIDKWLGLIATTVVADYDPPPLCRFEVNGRRYLHAPKWADHQRPQHPAMPKYPPCECPHDTLTRVSGESHETVVSANGASGVTAGQSRERDSQEAYGESHETLTPEQVVGAGTGGGGGAVARAREPRPRSTVTLLGNAILDEHKRLVKPSLPREVARKTGEQIDLLLDDPEIAPDEVREGLRRLRSNRRWGPGMLPHLVHEVRQERAGQGDPAAGRASSLPPTTDVRVGAGLDLAAKYAAEEQAARERGLP